MSPFLNIVLQSSPEVLIYVYVYLCIFAYHITIIISCVFPPSFPRRSHESVPDAAASQRGVRAEESGKLTHGGRGCQTHGLGAFIILCRA